MIFNAEVENGELRIKNQQKLAQFLENKEEKPLLVDIRVRRSIRSLPQNNLYWHYLSVIEEETGNLAHDLHEYFKRVLLPPRFIEIGKKNKKRVKIPGSTRKLSKGEFVDYMTKIHALTNVPIPDPEKAGFISNHGTMSE